MVFVGSNPAPWLKARGDANGERMEATIRAAEGRRMTYQEPVSQVIDN